MFIELSELMTGNGFSVNPIGFADIAAWERATETELTIWEKRLIIDIAQIYLRVSFNKKGVDKRGKATTGAEVSALMRGFGTRKVKRDGGRSQPDPKRPVLER